MQRLLGNVAVVPRRTLEEKLQDRDSVAEERNAHQRKLSKTALFTNDNYRHEKLGSDLGPFVAENQRTTSKTTQSRPKRDNNIAFLPRLRD